MFCRKCGEENPENAVFCRNCGERLIEDEVKKSVVIESPGSNYNQQKTQTTTSSSSSSDSSNWIGCCLCLIGVFIVFAILGALGF